MANLAGYFNIDHFESPNPAVLQRNVIFNIIYYMCRRGQENLYNMEKDWFGIAVENGDTVIKQMKDEMDKNHSEDSFIMTNQGRMYEVPGEIRLY